MNAQLFRHIAAKLYLDRDPSGIEIVRQFLAHTSSRTTLRVYAELQTDPAFRRLEEALLQVDNRPPPRRATPGRRPRRGGYDEDDAARPALPRRLAGRGPHRLGKGNRGDPLAPGGAGAGAAWRPISRRFVQLGYGLWLAWLKQEGGLDWAAPTAERATRVKVRAYLDALEAAGLADHTRAGRLQTLSDALRAMQPGADVGFIGRGAGRISSAAVRVRDPLAKMRPPSEIISYGAELMAEAEASRCALPVDRALMYRDGLLLSLWILRALRIANLASIEIGRQFLSDGAGGHCLEFAGSEMKNGRPFGCAWPEPIEVQLQTYLERYRPTLLARNKHGTDDKGLWTSQFRRRMKQASVGQAIMIRTESRFGVRMNPHLPRYILATTTAESHPERVSDVAAMLSHATLETSQRHYIRAGSLAAAERMQRTLLGRG